MARTKHDLRCPECGAPENLLLSKNLGSSAKVCSQCGVLHPYLILRCAICRKAPTTAAKCGDGNWRCYCDLHAPDEGQVVPLPTPDREWVHGRIAKHGGSAGQAKGGRVIRSTRGMS